MFYEWLVFLSGTAMLEKKMLISRKYPNYFMRKHRKLHPNTKYNLCNKLPKLYKAMSSHLY